MRGSSFSIFALSLLSACTRIVPQPGFDEVKQTIEGRLDKDIIWTSEESSNEDVNDRIRTILSGKITAESAVQLGLLNSSALQASLEELGVAQANLIQARLIRNPIFGADLKLRSGSPTKVELSLMQDVLGLAYLPLQNQIGAQGFEAAKLRAVSTILDLAAEIKRAFYSAQRDAAEVGLRLSVLQALEASSDLASRMYAAGNITLLQRDNERAEKEVAALALVSSEARAAVSREELNALFGAWGSQTDWKMDPKLPETPSEAVNGNDIEARAIERSLDLAIAKVEITMATAEVQMARPLSVFSDSSAGPVAEREDGNWYGGPSVEIPLPFFDQGGAEVVRARAIVQQKQKALRDLGVRIRAHARGLYVRVEAARQRAIYYKRVLLPLRQSIVNETQKEYNAMLIGAFDLLRAKREEIASGVEYIRALHEYWTARTNLDQLLNGRLFEDRPAEEDTLPSGGSRGVAH